MANYYASFRSNYFKVKDIADFKTWVDSFNIEFYDKDEGLVAVGSMDSGLPMGKTGPAPEYEYVDVEFLDELSKHLVDGEVAIVQEAGSEKLRYIVAYSVAVDSKGNQKWFNIDEVYNWADKEYGKEISRCQY